MPMLAVLGLAVAAWLLPGAADDSGIVGTQAPDFSLQDLNGKEVSLKSLRGHTVVLHFWATYWASCYADMGRLDKLSREFKSQGVIVLGVNVGQMPSVVKEFVKKKGFTYPQLVGARGELILSYEATDAPTLVIVGKDGKIVNYLREERGEEGLRSALKAALE
jgi:peroxiredoxin